VCLAMALSVAGMKLSDFATMKRRIVPVMAGADCDNDGRSESYFLNLISYELGNGLISYRQ
jgi:hypothetical protein